MSVRAWGSDVPVSSPSVPKREIRVRFGGFAFTNQGLNHDLTESDREDLLLPVFAPEGFDPRSVGRE